MEKESISRPLACLQRLADAISHQDLEAMTACFEPDYDSTFPVHPDRAFGGTGPMRRNWSMIFSSVPDIHAELVRYAVDGDTIWTEWEWAGTRVDGGPFVQRGVTIQGVPADRIAWVRLYIEPVQQGSGNEAAIRQAVSER